MSNHLFKPDPQATLRAFCADVAELVAYNWDDELRDYEEQDEEGRKNHIFLVLQRLRDGLRLA